MKIFCIGRNYTEHAQEMNSDVPSSPMIFMKPPTALNKNDFLYIPDFTSDLNYEAELVIKIKKHGKSIAVKHASRYYDQVGLGIDFTARDLQASLKENRHPWEIAKGFDNAAYVSPFTDIENIEKPISFSLEKNGKLVQQGNSSEMVFNFDSIVSYISQYFTLQMGDLIFTGTPQGVGPVEKGDILNGILDGEQVFEMKVR